MKNTEKMTTRDWDAKIAAYVDSAFYAESVMELFTSTADEAQDILSAQIQRKGLIQAAG